LGEDTGDACCSILGVLRLKVKLREGDLVTVTWLDAFGCTHIAWLECDEVDMKAEYSVESCGYYVGQSKKYLVLAGDMAEAAYGRVFYIPLGMIVKVQRT
jgi:hypothetical protein